MAVSYCFIGFAWARWQNEWLNDWLTFFSVSRCHVLPVVSCKRLHHHNHLISFRIGNNEPGVEETYSSHDFPGAQFAKDPPLMSEYANTTRQLRRMENVHSIRSPLMPSTARTIWNPIVMAIIVVEDSGVSIHPGDDLLIFQGMIWDICLKLSWFRSLLQEVNSFYGAKPFLWHMHIFLDI